MDIFSVSNNASLNPNKIAIICDDQVLSFSQIHQQVNLLKEHILENYSHIKHVGIFLDKGLEFLISFLAVIELNKVAVLLDPNWSSNQFNTIIDKYQLSLLITHDTLIKLNQLPSPKNFYSTLSLSFVNLSSKKQQYDFDDALLTPMLIGFTSGTTNLPKGFVLCQETWQKSFIMSTKCFGINTNDTIVAPGPLIHGLTLYPVIESLFNGTTAIVCSRFNTNFLNKILSQHEEICMTVPPTILMKFIEECNNLPYQSVKKIIVAGTKVDEKLILDSKKFFPAADIIDYYGASEIGFMGHRKLQHVNDLDKGFTLMDRVQVQIRDEKLNVLNLNESGNIWIKSDYLSLGYAFKDISSFNKVGDFATVNDQGYLDEKGSLHLIGRSQNMIISGGKNIYPTEVETILKKHIFIENVCVFGLPDIYWGNIVCAVIELKPNVSLSKQDLKNYCQKIIERYKFPKKVFVADNFPFTSSGKIKLNEVKTNVSNNLYHEIN